MYISQLKFVGVKMQHYFVNIANVSLENFPYVLDLKVTYTLTLLNGFSSVTFFNVHQTAI